MLSLWPQHILIKILILSSLNYSQRTEGRVHGLALSINHSWSPGRHIHVCFLSCGFMLPKQRVKQYNRDHLIACKNRRQFLTSHELDRGSLFLYTFLITLWRNKMLDMETKTAGRDQVLWVHNSVCYHPIQQCAPLRSKYEGLSPMRGIWPSCLTLLKGHAEIPRVLPTHRVRWLKPTVLSVKALASSRTCVKMTPIASSNSVNFCSTGEVSMSWRSVLGSCSWGKDKEVQNQVQPWVTIERSYSSRVFLLNSLSSEQKFLKSKYNINASFPSFRRTNKPSI